MLAIYPKKLPESVTWFLTYQVKKLKLKYIGFMILC